MKFTGIIKAHPLLFASIATLLPLFTLLLLFYLNRVAAFGCFDDCNNYIRGYFVLKGKALFSEVFSGHMPLMSYLSAFVQAISKPQSIYQLLQYHTLFLFAIYIISAITIVLRFRFAGLSFVILYEFYKFYLFGDRFLAEGVIIYPLVYMAGVVWGKINSERVFTFEYVLAAFLTWFVIFMREPYIPLAIVLYSLILLGKDELRIKLISVFLFLSSTIIFLAVHPINDFIFNVYTMNKDYIVSEMQNKGTGGIGLLKIFFYPFLVFFGGEWNSIRIIIISLCAVLTIFSIQLFKRNKILVLFMFFTLALANIRYVEPGKTFYGAYQLLIWYGILVMFVSQIIFHTKNKIGRSVAILSLGLIITFTLFSSKNHLLERVDTIQEVHDGFANYSISGRVIKMMANSESTLFVDGGDDLIYWRADLKPAYKYSWYTSHMPKFEIFNEARLDMFRNYPPDFYYGNCRKGYFLPEFAKGKYQNIKFEGKKTCIYVKRSEIPKVSEKAISDIGNLGFTL